MKHWFSDVLPFRHDPLSFFLDKAAKGNGPAVRLHLGPRRFWLITDAALAREILKQDERAVEKGFFVRKLRPIVGQSLLTINGHENARRRGALHAVLTKGVAQKYIPEMSGVVREAVVELVSSDLLSAHAFTAPLTLRMICVAMFGKSVLTRGDEALIVNAVKLVEADLARELFRPYPALPWQRRGQERRIRQARRMMQVVVDRVRVKAGESSILSALIALGLDDEAIRDEIVTMLIAGHHTTGSAAAWILYYLAHDQGLARRIAAEARSVAIADGEYTADGLARATISHTMIKEILRLFPSAYWFSRDALRNIPAGAGTIRAGDSLIICPWQLHRDPKSWPDPNSFDLSRSYSSRAYIPFGTGPRACIGMSLALLNLQLIAIELAAAFEFSFASEAPEPMPTGSVTLVPPQITLRARVRGQSAISVAAE